MIVTTPRRLLLALVALLAVGTVTLSHLSPTPARAEPGPAAVERERTLALPDGRHVTYRTIIDPSQADPDEVMDELLPGSTETSTPPGGASAAFRIFDIWAPNQIPVTVRYSPDGAPAGITGTLGGDAVAWAASQWNSIGSGMRVVAGDYTSTIASICDTPNDGDGVNSIQWRHGLRSGVLGSTCTVTADDNYMGYTHVLEADIVFSADMPWSIADPTPADRYDWKSTLLHEMGHVIGLFHTNEAGAVMLASLSKGTQRRAPQQDDIDGVRALYGPGPAPAAPPVVPPQVVPPGLTHRLFMFTVVKAR